MIRPPQTSWPDKWELQSRENEAHQKLEWGRFHYEHFGEGRSLVTKAIDAAGKAFGGAVVLMVLAAMILVPIVCWAYAFWRLCALSPFNGEHFKPGKPPSPQSGSVREVIWSYVSLAERIIGAILYPALLLWPICFLTDNATATPFLIIYPIFLCFIVMYPRIACGQLGAYVKAKPLRFRICTNQDARLLGFRDLKDYEGYRLYRSFIGSGSQEESAKLSRLLAVEGFFGAGDLRCWNRYSRRDSVVVEVVERRLPLEAEPF